MAATALALLGTSGGLEDNRSLASTGAEKRVNSGDGRGACGETMEAEAEAAEGGQHQGWDGELEPRKVRGLQLRQLMESGKEGKE